MRNLTFCALLLLLPGCASKQNAPASKLSDIETLPPHLVYNCNIDDLRGNILYRLPGESCVFFSDGSVIASSGKKLTAYDKKLKIKWSKDFTYLHHTFRKSEVADELLMLESQLDRGRKSGRRSDVMVVTDLNGHTLKKANFNALLLDLENFNPETMAAQEAHWVDAVFKINKPIFEKSHVNSFYELSKTVDGKKIHTGYVINCYFKRKIFLLDKELKKIVHVIDTGGRGLHDVHQLNDNQLIFYQNNNPNAKGANQSTITGYDLQRKIFFEIYTPVSGVTAPFCSSVQVLGEHRLLVTHSNCADATKTSRALLEYADLNNKKSTFYFFEPSVAVSNAQLQNLTEFLKNNSGM
jgi:hypothetical protein